MRDGILKWRFTCVSHISCGNSDNKITRVIVHFSGPISLARWPTIHLISAGCLAKVPVLKYINIIILK